MPPPKPNADPAEPAFSPPAQVIIEELKNLLKNIYADLDVPRDKIREVARRGRELAAVEETWAESRENPEDFLDALDRLERKINQTLDLKRLKEEGLVKAVKF